MDGSGSLGKAPDRCRGRLAHDRYRANVAHSTLDPGCTSDRLATGRIASQTAAARRQADRSGTRKEPGRGKREMVDPDLLCRLRAADGRCARDKHVVLPYGQLGSGAPRATSPICTQVRQASIGPACPHWFAAPRRMAGRHRQNNFASPRRLRPVHWITELRRSATPLHHRPMPSGCVLKPLPCRRTWQRGCALIQSFDICCGVQRKRTLATYPMAGTKRRNGSTPCLLERSSPSP